MPFSRNYLYQKPGYEHRAPDHTMGADPRTSPYPVLRAPYSIQVRPLVLLEVLRIPAGRSHPLAPWQAERVPTTYSTNRRRFSFAHQCRLWIPLPRTNVVSNAIDTLLLFGRCWTVCANPLGSSRLHLSQISDLPRRSLSLPPVMSPLTSSIFQSQAPGIRVIVARTVFLFSVGFDIGSIVPVARATYVYAHRDANRIAHFDFPIMFAPSQMVGAVMG